MAVAATAASTGSTRANAGMSSVPSPNPVKKVSAEATSAMMQATTSSTASTRYRDALDLLARLRAARSGLTIYLDRISGDRRAARLDLSAEPDGPDTLRITERWTRVRPPLPSSLARSWTRLRWSIEPDGLLIAHERLGAASAVRLVLLRRVRPGEWVGDRPHECHKDRYDARLLAPGSRQIDLVWTVQGPRKDAVIATRYRLDDR